MTAVAKCVGEENGRGRDFGHRARRDQRDLCGNRQALAQAADRHDRVEAAGVRTEHRRIDRIVPRLRVLLQFVAVVVIMLTIWAMGR